MAVVGTFTHLQSPVCTTSSYMFYIASVDSLQRTTEAILSTAHYGNEVHFSSIFFLRIDKRGERQLVYICTWLSYSDCELLAVPVVLLSQEVQLGCAKVIVSIRDLWLPMVLC